MLIRLQDLPVGTLRRERGEQWIFRTLESYRKTYPRPVLGQIFEDDLERAWRRRVRLPPFFSNLLPEGPLKSFLAQEVGVPPEREGFLLAHAGQDLPGAVTAEWEEGEEVTEGPTKLNGEDGGSAGGGDDAPLKFSLAGVQLKLSALQDERGLTIPASGQGGNWIVKLPLPAHAELPAVEWAMLEWADRAGFDVPAHELIEVEDVRNLPSEWPVRKGQALAVRRFDRPEPGHRIHQEDFAQILDVYPEDKYANASHETLGRILQALTGPEGLDEYVRRLVFVVLSGNGDAHLKNWTLVYPDGRTPKLSPVYDQVFTRAFLENDDLALTLGGERDFYRIDGDTFQRFAERVGAEPSAVGKAVKEVGERIRAAWSETRSDLPLTEEVERQLDSHIEKVQL